MRELVPPRTSPRWRPRSRVINSRMTLDSPWRLTPSTTPSSIHCIGAMYTQRSAASSWPATGPARSGRPMTSPAVLDASFPRKLQAHFAVALRIVAPAFAHFDEEKKVHRMLDRGGDFGARGGPNRLDSLTTLAGHDLALAFALHIDRLLDAHGAVFELLPDLGLDRRLVR